MPLPFLRPLPVNSEKRGDAARGALGAEAHEQREQADEQQDRDQELDDDRLRRPCPTAGRPLTIGAARAEFVQRPAGSARPRPGRQPTAAGAGRPAWSPVRCRRSSCCRFGLTTVRVPVRRVTSTRLSWSSSMALAISFCLASFCTVLSGTCVPALLGLDLAQQRREGDRQRRSRRAAGTAQAGRAGRCVARPGRTRRARPAPGCGGARGRSARLRGRSCSCRCCSRRCPKTRRAASARVARVEWSRLSCGSCVAAAGGGPRRRSPASDRRQRHTRLSEKQWRSQKRHMSPVTRQQNVHKRRFALVTKHSHERLARLQRRVHKNNTQEESGGDTLAPGDVLGFTESIHASSCFRPRRPLQTASTTSK